MTPTVELAGITVRFGNRTALDEVSFDLRPGVTGLLGPNGSGKTTLLRVLATVAAPDGGRVMALGHRVDTTAGRDRLRRTLGYLPQEPGFHHHFTVFEFVDYVAILKDHADRGARHEEVHRVVSLVGLEDRAGDRIKDLSGGMRRRVALAQSLLGDPELLVLDEPTAGLDPELRFWFRDLVSRLGEDRTVLLSTHQTEDVAAMCQDVVVLQRGAVRFTGTPAELATIATGRTWVADQRDEDALVAWRTTDGQHRHLGDPPADAQLVPPTLEDGYLVLAGPEVRSEVAA